MTDYDKSATFTEQKNTSKMKKLIGAAFLLSAFLVKAQIATGTSTTVGAENSKWTFGGYAQYLIHIEKCIRGRFM